MSGWTWVEIVLAAYTLWVVGACATLLLQRRSPTATLAWMFAFVALPGISGIYYLVFGPRRLRRRRIRYGIARGFLAGDVSAYLRDSCGRKPPRLSIDATALATVAHRLGQGMPTIATSVRLLDDGDAVFDSLAQAIHEARHHVHLEYYIWEPDEIGTRFRDLLIGAARRGVHVRLLYDGVGSPNVTNGFWAALREAGGEVSTFNPLRFSRAALAFANFRTHRKIVVCDGRLGFVGGMNIHDPASAARSGAAAWRDAHACLEGEPVRRLQRLFLENWIFSGNNFTLTPENLAQYFPPAGEPSGEAVQVLASGPDDERAPIHAFFLAAISTARKRVCLQTPYLIPDEPLESALRIAVLRAVDVEVIVPREGDSRLVTAASHTYCESLANAGVSVFEYGPPMLHAKTLLVDDTVGVIGTANMDNRSFRLNFEVAAAFYGRDTLAAMDKRFALDRDASRPFPLQRRGPRLTTFLESLARLTSPVL